MSNEETKLSNEETKRGIDAAAPQDDAGGGGKGRIQEIVAAINRQLAMGERMSTPEGVRSACRR